VGEKENMQTDYQTLWNKCLAVVKIKIEVVSRVGRVKNHAD